MLSKKLFYIFYSVLFSSSSFTQVNIVEGKVIDEYLQTNFANATILLNKRVKFKSTDVFPNDNILIDSFTTDTSGHFYFEIKDTGFYYLVALYKLDVPWDTVVINFDTLYANYISNSFLLHFKKKSKRIKQIVELDIYCPYFVTKDLKVCPCCMKNDKVCEIFYGLPMYDFDENMKIIGPKDILDKISGGCIVKRCQPSRYCSRCDKKF